MKLTEYEKNARREIDVWKEGESSVVHQVLNWSMRPFDYVVEHMVPADLVDQGSEAISDFLSMLSDTSEWTFDENEVLTKARREGLPANLLKDLRDQPLDRLDKLAKGNFNENAIVAALEGGGFSLGGPILFVAEIPVLFTINFRLIQQIGGAYGFSLRAPDYRPLVVAIFNVAASGSRESKGDALREMSVAAAAFAHDLGYRGRRASSTFRDQNRHVPREIAKNLVGRKLGQLIPVAGIAVGAGVNYWFTSQTAEASYMLFRYLHLERKERL